MDGKCIGDNLLYTCFHFNTVIQYLLTLYNKEEHLEVGTANFGDKAECSLSFVIDQKMFVEGDITLILTR